LQVEWLVKNVKRYKSYSTKGSKLYHLISMAEATEAFQKWRGIDQRVKGHFWVYDKKF
jgi:hypothetical protein